MPLTIAPGETVVYRHLFYKGQIRVNVMGRWKRGLDEPGWMMTDLEPERGLHLYLSRMKMDGSFHNVKPLLHLDSLMHKRQHLMEKRVALVLLAYAIGLLIGEAVRDAVYGVSIQEGEAVEEGERIPGQRRKKQGGSGSCIRGCSSCSSTSSS